MTFIEIEENTDHILITMYDSDKTFVAEHFIDLIDYEGDGEIYTMRNTDRFKP